MECRPAFVSRCDAYNRAVALLYGAYDREPGGALHHVATGQRLLPGQIVDDRVRFEYRDREINLPLFVELTDSPNRDPATGFGVDAVVDWNLDQHLSVKTQYGLWRRLTWFLLDALLVWLTEEGRPQRSVRVYGGWFNGSWLKRGRFFVSIAKPAVCADALLEEIPSYELVPLRTVSPRWRFDAGLPGAREGRIAVKPGNEDVPVADLRVPVDQQLSDVPRFISDDGSILFFHRVIPHTGPDYAPSMAYGLVGTDYAFYFSARSVTLLDVPIAMRPGGAGYPPRLRERVPDFLDTRLPNGRWRLHPVLREQLFFASAEANAVTFGKAHESWPRMRSVQHEQEMPFGYDLGAMSHPPISVGLRAGLRSWPRFSSEPPEFAATPSIATGSPTKQWVNWLRLKFAKRNPRA